MVWTATTGTTQRRSRGEARTALLDAALHVIRTRGLAATSVDDPCAAAGATRRAFVHHFASKKALAVAVHYAAMADWLFADAPYRRLADPLARLFGYLDFHKAILHGALPDFTGLPGTMVPAAGDTHPPIRAACVRRIGGHAAPVETDIAAAIDRHGTRPDGWTAASLALNTQAVLQGAFILATARSGPDIAADSVDHLYRHVARLFGRVLPGGATRAGRPQ